MTKPEQEAPRKLMEKDFAADVAHAYWRCAITLPVGWSIADCLKPEFWQNVGHKFQKQAFTGEPEKTGAVIEVRTLDHAFYAELYVRAVRGGVLDVAVLREPVYFGPKASEASGFEVRWNVGKRGFDIIRKSDREIVEDAGKFPTKELALKWIESMTGMKAAA